MTQLEIAAREEAVEVIRSVPWRHADGYTHTLELAIAKALLTFAQAQIQKAVEEEREACAKVAETGSGLGFSVGMAIARQIRSRTQGGSR